MSSIIFIPLLAFTLCCYMHYADEYNTKYFNLFSFIALIIFSFLIGVRVNFGNDHINYMQLYMSQDLTYFEPIYAYINKMLYAHRFPFQILFMLIAFIEFFFLEKAAKLLNMKLVWVVLFFFLFRFFAFFVNGLRQATAISITMCAVIFFFKKYYFGFLLLIALSVGFHKSSLIFLLLCPFVKKLKMPKKKYIDFLYFLPLFFALVFYNHIWDTILGMLSKVSNYLPQQLQAIVLTFSVWKIDLGSGLGVKLQILGYVLLLPNLIFYAKREKLFQYLFIIFYIGIIGKYFSGQNMNLSRVFFGLEYCGIFLTSSVIPRINKKNILIIRNVLFICGILIYLLLFFYDSMKGVNTIGPTPYIWDLDFTFKNYFHGGL